MLLGQVGFCSQMQPLAHSKIAGLVKVSRGRVNSPPLNP